MLKAFCPAVLKSRTKRCGETKLRHSRKFVAGTWLSRSLVRSSKLAKSFFEIVGIDFGLMSDLPILVTGATGLVGNNVVRLLLDQGRQVRVLVRPTHDARRLEGLEVDRVEGDVCDAESVRRAADGAGVVVHSAAYVRIGWRNLDHYQRVNIDGTRNVAQAAREVGARMIQVSSSDAVTCESDQQPADETSTAPPRVAAPYVTTKRAAEQAVHDEIAAGLDTVIANPGFMLGPWDWAPSSGQMLLAVAGGKALLAPRGGMSLCDVRDVASGIVSAIDSGRAGERYLLTGKTISYLDAWRLFAEITGGRRPLFRPGPAMQWIGGKFGDLWGTITGNEPLVNSAAVRLSQVPKHYNHAKATAELNYTTRPIEQTVRDAWEWFRANGYA